MNERTLPTTLKVAVVGGGIFGCMTAIDIAKAGATVHLFESQSDILEGTTARNMARLHSGYHYPRSDLTAVAARDAAPIFIDRYPTTITPYNHYYVIAPGSKVSPNQYIDFCTRLQLSYEIVDPKNLPMVHTADLIVKVPEALIDISNLRQVLRRDLRVLDISIHTDVCVQTPELPGYDLTVWATYGVPWSSPLRYEICEIPVIELGRYNHESFVVLDGDYVSLDPYRKLYTLYDVVHSVHHVMIGTTPDIPMVYKELLARPPKVTSPLSKKDLITESASRFFWGLSPYGQHPSIYHGSLWSLRAVLPDVDNTDERPTLVKRDNDKVIRILSGKLCTAATVGSLVLDQILEPVTA